MNFASIPLVLFWLSCTHAGALKPQPAAEEPQMSMAPAKEPPIVPDLPKCGDSKFCVPVYSLKGVIDEAQVLKTVTWLIKAKVAGAKAVVIEINSPGGSVDDGFDLIRFMEELDLPIYCVAENKVASEGFAVLQACTYRLMTRRAILMTHRPYMVLSGLKVVGIPELEEWMSSLKATARAFAEACVKRMKIKLPAYEAKVDGKDWTMGPDEALTVGAVDGIATSVREVRDTLRSKGKF